MSTACGFVGFFSGIKDQDRDGLDGVARGFQNLQAQAGKVEGISIRHGHKGIFRLGAAAKINGCAAAVAQLQMAGNEVGMEVGQKDVANVEAPASPRPPRTARYRAADRR